MNNTNDRETSSPSTSNDGLHTHTHTQTIQKQKHKPLPPPQHNNNNKQLTLGKKHYIVGSMDSDKMFIPPVPMTNKNTYNMMNIKIYQIKIHIHLIGDKKHIMIRLHINIICKTLNIVNIVIMM
eukprot:428047_1